VSARLYNGLLLAVLAAIAAVLVGFFVSWLYYPVVIGGGVAVAIGAFVYVGLPAIFEVLAHRRQKQSKP
jgi:hypothetical protein